MDEWSINCGTLCSLELTAGHGTKNGHLTQQAPHPGLMGDPLGFKFRRFLGGFWNYKGSWKILKTFPPMKKNCPTSIAELLYI